MPIKFPTAEQIESMLTKRLILKQEGKAFTSVNAITIYPGDEITVDVHFEDGTLGHALLAIGRDFQFSMTATGEEAETLKKMQKAAFP